MSTPTFLSESYATLSDTQKQTYSEINAKRADIEKKFAELDRAPGSYYQLQQSDYETTILAGILWTMLATGTIYYVFVRV